MKHDFYSKVNKAYQDGYVDIGCYWNDDPNGKLAIDDAKKLGATDVRRVQLERSYDGKRRRNCTYVKPLTFDLAFEIEKKYTF